MTNKLMTVRLPGSGRKESLRHDGERPVGQAPAADGLRPLPCGLERRQVQSPGKRLVAGEHAALMVRGIPGAPSSRRHHHFLDGAAEQVLERVLDVLGGVDLVLGEEPLDDLLLPLGHDDLVHGLPGFCHG